MGDTTMIPPMLINFEPLHKAPYDPLLRAINVTEVSLSFQRPRHASAAENRAAWR